jgi:hypothetical protein
MARVWSSALLAVALLGSGLHLPSGLDPTRKSVRPGRGGTAVSATPTPVPASPPLTDGDVDLFVREWPAFRDAVSAIGEGADDATAAAADSLPEADRAVEADAAFRKALSALNTDPDAFLSLYRRVSAAWWAMVQADDRTAADETLDREIAELERVSGADGPGAEAAREMRATDDAFHQQAAARPSEVPKASIDVVRKNRDRLSPIFGL